MVRICIAGGSGQVAKEVIDALLATSKHEITILSRSVPANRAPSAVHWRAVNYNDQPDLEKALRGTHTLLSFVQLLSDPEGNSQKTLIDAAIAAGVKRFAPSEYGSAGTTNMPWWAGKESTRQYLKKVNEKGKVLEYTLFQPGLFLDYLAFPYKTAKHVDPLQTVFDFQNCRALTVDGYENAVISLTTVNDMAAIIARAVDYEGEWPEVSGIQGNRVTFAQVIETGEKIRGRRFTVETVKAEDLEAGILDTSWALAKRHQAVSEDQYSSFVKTVSIGMLLSSIRGAWDVSDELNALFPKYEFDSMTDFLVRVWSGKP